jgi:hypothetical protein
MTKKTLTRGLIFLLAGLLMVTGIFCYLYNKPGRSAASEKGIMVSAEELARAFEKDEKAANKIYLDKTLDVKGVISEINSNQQGKTVIVLQGTDMAGVQCTLLQTKDGLKKNDSIHLKGICTGFLTDVVIDRCVLSE